MPPPVKKMVLVPSLTPWSFVSLRPCETQLSVFIATASAGTRWVCPPSVFTKSYLPLPDRGARYLFYGQEFTALGHRVLVALKEKWTLLIFCGKFRLPYLSKATAVPRAELPCLTSEHSVVAFNFLLYNGDYLLILPKQLEKKLSWLFSISMCLGLESLTTLTRGDGSNMLFILRLDGQSGISCQARR